MGQGDPRGQHQGGMKRRFTGISERDVMKLPHRRQFLHLAAGAAVLPAVSRIAGAQSLSDAAGAHHRRPLPRVASNDILARLVGQWLSERLGQPFVVENRPGAGGNIGTEAVVRAPPDGYTLLRSCTGNAINATLYDKLNFNFIRDIAPVAGIIRGPYVVVVNPSVPAKTIPEFIAYAKANPGKINMASAGTGTGPHVAGELFKMMSGVNMVHVPYRGGGPALTDLLGGQVQVYFAISAGRLSYIRAGKLRALAVTTASALGSACRTSRRLANSVPGYEASAWLGHRRAEEHAHRDRREAQQGDQRGPRRSQDQGAARRFGRHGASGLAVRFRQAHR